MSNRPIVGIIARPEQVDKWNGLMVIESYKNAIIISGGNPILILPSQLVEYNSYEPKELSPLSIEEKAMIIDQINLCDGILMPGGTKRYEYDRFITEYCLDKDIPILGICLGMQLLATHINRDTLLLTDDNFSHSKPQIDKVHPVKLKKDSLLYEIIGEEEFYVNSRHRFKVTDVGNFSIVGYSHDGVVEAIEDSSKKFAIGVQWHPENLMDTNSSKKLFNSFIERCRK